MGGRDGRVPDRGSRVRGRQGPLDLGRLFAAAGPGREWRDGQRRLRSLPPLPGRCRAHAPGRSRDLSLFDLVAQGAAFRIRGAQRSRPRLLRPARRRTLRERHPPLRDALPLGPAAGTPGPGRLVEPRHCEALRGLRGPGFCATRRSGDPLGDPQRTDRDLDGRTPGRGPGARYPRSRDHGPRRAPPRCISQRGRHSTERAFGAGGDRPTCARSCSRLAMARRFGHGSGS